MTRNMSARPNHCPKSYEDVSPTALSSHGTSTTSTARPNTAGVYTRAKRRMNSSVGALRADASSTRCSMRDTADSPAGRNTRRRTTLPVAIIPADTSLPVAIARGSDSPVRADVSNAASAVSSSPSRGTRSPGFTSIVSPTATSSGAHVTTSPFLTTAA